MPTADRCVRSTLDLEGAGRFQVSWNGKTNRGKVVSPGRYTYTFATVDHLGNKGRSEGPHVAVSGNKLVRHVYRDYMVSPPTDRL